MRPEAVEASFPLTWDGFPSPAPVFRPDWNGRPLFILQSFFESPPGCGVTRLTVPYASFLIPEDPFLSKSRPVPPFRVFWHLHGFYPGGVLGHSAPFPPCQQGLADQCDYTDPVPPFKVLLSLFFYPDQLFSKWCGISMKLELVSITSLLLDS